MAQEISYGVFNDFWLVEYLPYYIPESDEDLNDAIYEEQNELSVSPKYVRRGDNGKWQKGDRLIKGKDFEVIDYVAQPISELNKLN